ncbi:bifunctional diguanylate cyclase/phosphohydrolase [Desulfuribacillus alkaliarsenatis]|uniref:Diguanylate cyclase n=1 Tax=Desulfuribacillus alkaliarsenatis TaxID=766136 RepID=A0A1E5FYH0_9FIRM|nr:HD domain-containing phosphohydrolase [Desulfuribacillus alkaliarsenatis]OEF95623.1 hypothetical protein BHF68_12325 [Desulfuribacillus alkaliarsenatis]
MANALRVLYIEDLEDDAILVTRALKKAGIDLIYTRIQTEEDMIEQLTGAFWDLIICDYAMPDFDAMSALQTLQELGYDLPFIVVSGTIGEEQAVALMKAGAHDYVMKENTTRLAPVIKRELQEAKVRRLKREAERNLQIKERNFRKLAENSLDYILRITHEGIINYANKAAELYFKNIIETLAGKEIKDISSLIPSAESENAMAKVMGNQKPINEEIQTANDRWIDWQFIPEHDASNKISTIMFVGRDITGRKNLENELRYLSHHDPLTGLNNRIHLEKQMHILESIAAYPVGIVVCDIDGLKMINDSLGHEAGDMLLQQVGKLLKASLPTCATVARVGGDEFAILMHKISLDAFKHSIESICDAMETYNDEHDKLPISLSIGYHYSSGEDTIIETYRKADNHMYREKLHKAQSTRSGIVQMLIKALEVRDFETEKHMERMEELAVLMGKKLQLPESKITDLRLFARFHDIGKVGIPDEILFKPGPLTGKELEVMKTHSEIGQKIARSASELQHIAGLILQHHEWWNGEGYPLGNKYEQIPLECRILAIADAYDAMTSNRPYRKAMSKEIALEEINKQKGIQFDPKLVELFLSLESEL